MEGPVQGWIFFKIYYQGSYLGIPEREQTELQSRVALGGGAELCDGGRLLTLLQPWQPGGRTEAVALGAWGSILRCPALCRGHLGCFLLLCCAVFYICISYLQMCVCV